MIQKRNSLIILEPSEGMVYTQKENVNLENRVITDRIYLGVNDSEDNWKEITLEEAEILKQRIDAYNEEQLKLIESSQSET